MAREGAGGRRGGKKQKIYPGKERKIRGEEKTRRERKNEGISSHLSRKWEAIRG